MNYESLALLGAPFEPVETYVYFDGRQTFAMRSTVLPDLFYIVNTVDESDDGNTLTALAVAVNKDRFRAIRSGFVPFRDAFEKAAPFSLFRIDWTFAAEGQPTAEIGLLRAADVELAWLPADGARLNIPTQTVEPYVPNELVSLANAQARTIFAIEVATPNNRITGFPGRNAGELQVAVDRELVALTKEILAESKTKSLSSAHAREIHSSVLGLKAASFVLVMGIDTVGSMVEATDVVRKVFERFNALVASVGETDEAFLSQMKEHGSTVRNRFLDVLDSLERVGSGLALSSVIANTTEVVRTAASPDRVRSSVAAIRNVAPKIEHVDIGRGILTGLILSSKRFVIVDAADLKKLPYKGEMTKVATESANGLRVGDDSFVTARIRVEIPFAGEDEAAGTKYILESIKPFDATTRELPTLNQ